MIIWHLRGGERKSLPLEIKRFNFEAAGIRKPAHISSIQ